MGNEVLQRIDALAAKLGVAAGEVWKILVKQSVVEAWQQVATGVVFVLVMVAFIYFGRWCWKRYEESGGYGDWNTSALIAYSLALIPAVIAICSVITAISRFVNPEYYALQVILETLKPVAK